MCLVINFEMQKNGKNQGNLLSSWIYDNGEKKQQIYQKLSLLL